MPTAFNCCSCSTRTKNLEDTPMQPSCSLQASCRTQVSHPKAGPDVPATCKALSIRAHAVQQTKHHKCLQHALQQQNTAQARNAPESHKVRTNSRPGDACNMHFKTRTKPQMRRKYTNFKPKAGLGMPSTRSQTTRTTPPPNPQCAGSTQSTNQRQA
jgi:hypothetical protein